MPIPQETLYQIFQNAFPQADIHITDLAGDDDHYAAHICAYEFQGKTIIQQHQMVYGALKGKMGSNLHALSLTTKPKENKNV